MESGPEWERRRRILKGKDDDQNISLPRIERERADRKGEERSLETRAYSSCEGREASTDSLKGTARKSVQCNGDGGQLSRRCSSTRRGEGGEGGGVPLTLFCSLSCRPPTFSVSLSSQHAAFPDGLGRRRGLKASASSTRHPPFDELWTRGSLEERPSE